MTGVYKISLKKNPKKYYIIGTVNIDQYWSQNGNKNLEYKLIWECNKFNLDRFTIYFQEKYGSTFNEPEKLETAIIEPTNVEKAVIKQPRKKSVKSKSKK